MASAGRVLMIPTGEWVSGNDYGMLDVVHHLGSSYVARNHVAGGVTAPSDDSTNWQLLAQGYDVTDILTKNQLVSNTTTNDTRVPASAAAVYQNAQSITQLNSDLANYKFSHAVSLNDHNKASGIYSFYSATMGIPVAEDSGFAIINNMGNGNVLQFLVFFGGSNLGKMATRRYKEGSWEAWNYFSSSK